MNNYFITGEMGVGKSTVLAQVLHKLKPITAGFVVSRINAENGKPLLFKLKKAAELKTGKADQLKKLKSKNFDTAKILKNDLKNEIFAYRSDTESKFKLRPEVFDKLGVELLNQRAEIYLMDELGRFELEADKFQRKIFTVLDSKKPVFGVIKAEENRFLNKIRRRNDLQIYHLKAKNRGKIYNQLINDLRNLLNT